MKPIIISAILLLALNINLNAQNLIAVHHVGTPSFYTTLDSAVTHAQNGDTIYIPGGNFTISDTINKCIHLVGAGHHPDSANVTSRTIISGSRQIILKSGADNGSVTGIYFNDPGYYSDCNILIIEPVSAYTISRCYVSKIIAGYSAFGNNLTITENIIVNLSLQGTNNSLFNNIFLGAVNIYSSTAKNNVFTFSQAGYSQYAFYGNDCITENNIFKPGSAPPNNWGGNIIYHNNVNAGVNGISGTNQGSGNFLDNIPLQSIFVSYDPATIGGDGIYSADFHLPINSPYKNAGRDGTDIGIYGGAFPWKAGSIPFNPHFQSFQIGSTTNPSGNLNVNIKVAAQDR